MIFRPWFIISSYVCETENNFKFKIINLSLVKCTNLNIYLRKVSETDAFPKGKDVTYELIPVNTDSFIYISGILSGILNSHRPNCVQVKVEKEHKLDDIIKNNGTYLELIVSAQHGMSNLQTTKKKNYKHVDYLKKGVFKSGFTFSIK